MTLVGPSARCQQRQNLALPNARRGTLHPSRKKERNIFSPVAFFFLPLRFFFLPLCFCFLPLRFFFPLRFCFFFSVAFLFLFIRCCERYTHKTPLLTLPAVICLSLLLHLSLVHRVILPTHSRWLKSRLAKQTSSDRHLSISYQHGSGARRLAAPGADS